MKNLIYKLINNKKITLFFVFLIIAVGIFSYVVSPKQESPDFSIPYALVTTVFPGASQQDVDEFVSVPILDTLSEIEGIETTSAYSSNSLSLIIVEFDFNADREKKFSELKESMSEVSSNLPEECSEIDVNTKITDTSGVLISLSSRNLDNEEIAKWADYTGKKLKEIDGIIRYEIIGARETRIMVRVRQEDMVTAGLTLAEINTLISGGNIDIPMGNISEDNEYVAVNYTGTYENIQDIEELIIGYIPELQKELRLGDIADITIETAPSNTYYSHNGRETVIIGAYFDEDINIVPFEEEIADTLASLDDIYPSDLESSLIISQPEEVKDSLENFASNLLIAVGLVIIVILIGMGARNALVVSVSLPLSILLSFGAMYVLGIRIQQISIAALIVSLGMLVDNSIVVSDSIQGYLDSGMKKKKACAAGVKDVAVPILASTVTTIAAFLPFLFLNSIAGDYIKGLPQIIAISLTASYLTAMLIIPVLGFILFRAKEKKTKKKSTGYFKKILKAGLKRKWAVLILVIMVITGTVFLAMELDTVFFPASEKDIIYIDIRNDISDDTRGTGEIVRQIEDILEKEEVVTEITSAFGGALPRFNQIMYIYTKTPDIGQIMMRVDLSDSDYNSNGEYKSDLQDKIDALGLDAKVTVKELMYAFPMDEDIKIRISGLELKQLKEYESQIHEILTAEDGLVNVNKGNTDYIDEYSLSIDESKAALNGIMIPELQNELSIAIRGRETTVIREEGKEIPVIVTGGELGRISLDTIPIRTMQKDYIMASQVSVMEKTESLSTIPRYNGEYAMSLTADYNPDFDKADVINRIKEAIDDLNMKDTSVEYEGEDQLIKENFGQVGILGIVALAAVFIILLIQFRSYSLPILIFITIPLSAVGSVAGLYLTGQAVSFTALLGIVSLLGIVVNNAIILIDYIKKEQDKGVKIKKACLNASSRRMRPILLSTITTVIGLIPLAVGSSQLFKPMAIALMSGLLVSTLLTLIVLPVFVSGVYKNK